MSTEKYKTWLEIDSQAIYSNWHIFRQLLPRQTKIMAVVKANAYGHDLVPFAKIISVLGVDSFGVDSLSDAKKLREAKINQPILVLGHVFEEEYDEAARLGVSITLSSAEGLRSCGTLRATPISVHIKVDTGMHEQGFSPEEKDAVLAHIKECGKSMRLDGIYTQFASTRHGEFLDYTMGQIETFDAWQTFFQNAGFSFLRHTSATTGAIMYPAGHFDMVRVGAGLYGLWPSSNLATLFKEKLMLREALSWRTLITDTKKLRAGDRVGYDLTHTLGRDSVIAHLPIGYASGYPRHFSNKGFVLVRGKRAPIIGRISMDGMTIDVTDIPDVVAGDTVTLIGEDGEEKISIYEFADMAGEAGSHYEALVRINPEIPRIYSLYTE